MPGENDFPIYVPIKKHNGNPPCSEVTLPLDEYFQKSEWEEFKSEWIATSNKSSIKVEVSSVRSYRLISIAPSIFMQYLKD